MKFIGRGRSLSSPAAFDQKSPLSNTVGSTLDPIVSIRHRLVLQPGESVRVDIVTGVAETRTACRPWPKNTPIPSLADRVFELAWTRGPIMLQQLNASEADAQAYGRLAGSVIYASPCDERDERADSQSTRPIRTVGIWNLRRSADCAGSNSRCRKDRTRA
jgi:cyclic beta-1,2-glucan synthetase